MQEAITIHEISANVVVIRDGEEAIRLINETDADPAIPCPGLFLLDLNIPARSGEEILAYIRNSARCRGTPVVVVTSSKLNRDRAKAAALGASRYFCKPTDYDEYMEIGQVIKEVLDIET